MRWKLIKTSTVISGLLCCVCAFYLLLDYLTQQDKQTEQLNPPSNAINNDNKQIKRHVDDFYLDPIPGHSNLRMKYHDRYQQNGNIYQGNTDQHRNQMRISNRTIAGLVEARGNKHSLIAMVWPKSSNMNIAKQNYLPARRKINQLQKSDSSNCDMECQHFQHLMQSWHTVAKSKPKAAFYYLTRLSRLKDLKKSLQSVDINFNNHYKYPIIIFHEADMISSINIIRTWTNSSLFFQLISFAIPEFLEKERVREDIACPSTIGYRHMCRFQCKLVYSEPIMKELEFYWRLDDDSVLTQAVDYDVFTHMQIYDYQYGYIWLHRDAKDCVVHLWNSTWAYITINNIAPNDFPRWHSPLIYYNNFEISSMNIWKSKEYKAFIEYIDQLGGIYYYRWGDAPIKAIALSLFVSSSKIHHFKDIGYKHSTFINP